eukprot:3808534-Amphidinium_carterae.2
MLKILSSRWLMQRHLSVSERHKVTAAVEFALNTLTPPCLISTLCQMDSSVFFWQSCLALRSQLREFDIGVGACNIFNSFVRVRVPPFSAVPPLFLAQGQENHLQDTNPLGLGEAGFKFCS